MDGYFSRACVNAQTAAEEGAFVCGVQGDRAVENDGKVLPYRTDLNGMMRAVEQIILRPARVKRAEIAVVVPLQRDKAASELQIVAAPRLLGLRGIIRVVIGAQHDADISADGRFGGKFYRRFEIRPL